MSFNRLSCSILLLALLAMTGCAKKISLGTISNDLNPTLKVTGKVHVLPVADNARVGLLSNGYYNTITNQPGSEYISTTRPSEIIEKSIVSCLTQSGLTVTSGPNAPDDSDIVLSSNFKAMTLGPTFSDDVVGLVLALGFGVATANIPHGGLVIENQMADGKTRIGAYNTFIGDERSTHHWSYKEGAETAFRLVQEKYCGWLQEKIAAFKADSNAPATVSSSK